MLDSVELLKQLPAVRQDAENEDSNGDRKVP
jgi:hypothetical protein